MARYKKAAAALLLAFVMLFASVIPAFAIPHGDVRNVPSGFWGVFNPYSEAWTAGNSAGIVTHGSNLIYFWLAGQTVEQRAAQWGANPAAFGFPIDNVFVAGRRVGDHAKLLGDHDTALWGYTVAYTLLDAYQALSPLIGNNPADLEFTRIQLRNQIAALNVGIQVFAEMRDGTGITSFTNTLHEPRTGVFFGQPFTPTMTTTDSIQGPSAVTIYVEFETQVLSERVLYDLQRIEELFGFSRHDFGLIQVVWNFLNEGHTPPTVLQQTQKITEAAHFLRGTGLPILLRIGGEVDVWTTPADPAEFRAAFRHISNIMRREAPNVAIAYSVNSVSNQGVNWMTFYPGEQYVDWVGISLYTIRYFMGNPHTSDADAAIWRTGQFANPVQIMRELVDMFGDRHPIYISEGGVSLFNVANNEDLTHWALPRMRQMYTYIPMLFPEVKAMFWFNVHVPGGNQRYDFAVSPAARVLYGQLTSLGHFLGRGMTQSPITYRPLGTATMPANAVTLLTYAPFFTLDGVVVQYWLNGRWVAQSADIPYRAVLNLSNEADGIHALEVRVLHGGNVLQSRDFTLSKQGNLVTISAAANLPQPSPTPAPTPTPSPTPTPPPTTIAEQPSIWAADLVNAAIAEGLVPLNLQALYTRATTRAEFASLAVALYENIGGEITGRSTFADTSDVDVQKAAYIGVVLGVGNNMFDPHAPLTREQAAIMLSRLVTAAGRSLPQHTATFADNAQISSWAFNYVGPIQAAGIMTGVGDNMFAPRDPYTREQSIVTIMRLFNALQ